LKKYTSLQSSKQSIRKGSSPNYDNTSLYSNEMVDSWYAYHSIIDEIKTCKIHFDQCVLLANRFLASASNNFDPPGYMVSTKPRVNELDEDKQSHEQPCLEERGGLGQTTKHDSQIENRPNTHCNVSLSPTLEGLSKAHT